MNSPVTKHTLFYGWIIVLSCVVIQTMQYGIQYSFGIFFKPIISDFGWSRGATAGAYSVLMLSAGLSAIPLGWLADRFGPAKIIAAGGFLTGLALVLTSRVTELWQLYLTFGFMQGIAIGGTIAITSGVTARWFFKRRGLALGIVSAAIGLGTLILPPIAERLIADYGWSRASLIMGIAAGIATIVSASLLKRDPEAMGLKPYGLHGDIEKIESGNRTHAKKSATSDLTLRDAVLTVPMWVLTIMFFLINICVQVVMVHIVNYATDLGIESFTAATIVSVIGVGSIVGRLVMGTVSDRIGSTNSLIITSVLLSVSLIWLIFSQQLWMLYIFAILFSFAYGGEVPQMTLLISQFFGIASVMALTGVTSTGIRIGGALGSWLGGQIFDVSQSYFLAFVITAVIGLSTFAIAIVLKKIRTKADNPV